MDPHAIADHLTKGRDETWSANLVHRDDEPALVPASFGGLFKCVDGRPSDRPNMRGPKVLGGIYAIASMRQKTEAKDLEEIVEEVRKAGYEPSVHGDDHTDPWGRGCGYFKLWKTGKLGLPEPKFTAREGRQAVLDAGGVLETLEGRHFEDFACINLVPNTTIEPNATRQRFVVDAWVVAQFGLDTLEYLKLAATTVEKLNGNLWAKIVHDPKRPCPVYPAPTA